MHRRVGRVLLTTALVIALSGLTGLAQDVKLVWTFCCAQESRRVLFEELARQYSEQTPGVEVEAIYPGGSYPATIQTWIAGGTQVDVMWTGQNMWAFPFEMLDDLVDVGGDIRSVHPSMMQSGEWLGHQVVIPYGANTHTFAYNTSLFDEAGLAYPTADWNWDEAIEMAEAITRDTNNDGVPEQAGLLPYSTAVFASFLNYGGDSYSEDGRKLDLTNPGAVAGANLYVDITKRLGIAPAAGTEVAWQNGNIGMQQIGIFNVPSMRVDGLSWDIAPLPGLNVEGERRTSTFVSMEAWGINRLSQHKNEARDFVRWLFSEDVMAQIGAAGVVIPTSSYGYASFLGQNPPPANLQAFIDSFAYGHQQIGTHPAGSDVWAAIAGNALYTQMINDQADPGAVLPELERVGQAVLDEYWSKQ